MNSFSSDRGSCNYDAPLYIGDQQYQVFEIFSQPRPQLGPECSLQINTTWLMQLKKKLFLVPKGPVSDLGLKTHDVGMIWFHWIESVYAQKLGQSGRLGPKLGSQLIGVVGLEADLSLFLHPSGIVLFWLAEFHWGQPCTMCLVDIAWPLSPGWPSLKVDLIARLFWASVSFCRLAQEVLI